MNRAKTVALAGWNPDLDSIRWHSIYANAPKIQCCDFCGRDTRPGTGLFVNRIPSDIGYGCPDCMMYECDRCHKPIDVDEDVCLEDTDERVHYECITAKELSGKLEQYGILYIDEGAE